MFHYSDKVDWNQFHRFDKHWISNMNWARISPAAKAVFPVIARHCNERGTAFPGEETIAALSGLSEKSVRKGIHDLEGFPGFDWEYYTSRHGRRSKRFTIVFPPEREEGRAFFFYRVVIDGGMWRKRNEKRDTVGLIESAQALYPVMRFFSYYDAQEYNSEEDEGEGTSDPMEFKEQFKARKWELCSAEFGQLAKYAGIDRHTIKNALKSLEENFLVKPYETDGGEKVWQVFVAPQTCWDAKTMNQRLKSEARA